MKKKIEKTIKCGTCGFDFKISKLIDPLKFEKWKKSLIGKNCKACDSNLHYKNK